MKEKHLKIFAGVFVFLLVLFFVTKPRVKTVNVDELVQSIVIGMAMEDVKGIEVYKETKSENPVQLTLAKQDDQWRITSYLSCKAKNNQVEKLIKDVLDMTGKVRSSDPKHFEKYAITDAEGLHLLLKDETGKTLANLIIGKEPEDSESGFVRFADKEKVYFVDKNLLSSVGVTGDIDTLTTFNLSRFKDLQAVNKDKDKLETIVLVSEGKNVQIKKVEKQVEVKKDSITTTETQQEWALLKGNKEVPLDQQETTKFINAVKSIYAADVVDRIGNSFADMNKSSQYGLDHARSAIIFDEGSGQQRVIFGKSYGKDEGVYMYVEYDNLVYKLAKSNFDRITKWVDDLPKKTK